MAGGTGAQPCVTANKRALTISSLQYDVCCQRIQAAAKRGNGDGVEQRRRQV